MRGTDREDQCSLNLRAGIRVRQITLIKTLTLCFSVIGCEGEMGDTGQKRSCNYVLSLWVEVETAVSPQLPILKLV